MRIEAKISTAEVDKLLAALPSKIVIPATKRALKRATSSTAAEASRMIREHSTIRAGELRRKRIVSLLANGAGIFIRGVSFGLESFAGTRQTNKGVSVQVLKAGGRSRIRSAFIANINGPKVMRRRTVGGRQVGRLPIERLFGPAPASIISRPHLLARLTRHAADAYSKNIIHELKFRLSTLGRRVTSRRR